MYIIFNNKNNTHVVAVDKVGMAAVVLPNAVIPDGAVVAAVKYILIINSI